jgi:hypothetical protein
MVSSGMLRRVALLKTDVSEEPSASFIRVTRIGELGTILAATSNRRTLRPVDIQFANHITHFPNGSLPKLHSLLSSIFVCFTTILLQN